MKKDDFMVLKTLKRGKPIIYMDSACQSLRPKQVVDKINEYYNSYPSCGGRSYHSLSKQVDENIDKSRNVLQKFFNARKKQEIIFVRNTTEGINLVANSLGLKSGDIVITTDKEHNSNLIPWQILSKKGIIHEVVEFGNVEALKSRLRPEVKLVSMCHTSNLDGTSIPAKKIIKLCHENKSLVMLDGAQSAPHKKIDVQNLDVDFFVCSGHKMCGPSGTGVLYAKYKILEQMKPFIVGGETVSDSTYTSFKLLPPPERFEAGLQNYAGIIGLGAAVEYLMKIGLDKIQKHEIMLNKKITDALGDKVELIGPKDASLRGGIFSFNIKGQDPHEIAIMLDNSANIMVRSGAHCVHSWFNKHKMNGSIRASLYFYNTEQDCDIFIKEMNNILNLFS